MWVVGGAEDGIRDGRVTGVQTCALPISQARMNVGIDASNLRSGGGMTYVVELLAHADPARHGIDKVTLWASEAMLARTAPRPWLERVHVQIGRASCRERV